jgi:hypothetical protein
MQQLMLRSVDKLEQMLGSYGPHPQGEAYTKNFDPEESPSGMLARSGTYNVKSRVVDDDGEVYAGMVHTYFMDKDDLIHEHAQIGSGSSSSLRNGDRAVLCNTG